MEDKIRHLLETAARLKGASGLSLKANLFDAGMNSFGCVQLMLGIEEAFGIEFPDELLVRTTFETISVIKQNIIDLQPQ